MFYITSITSKKFLIIIISIALIAIVSGFVLWYLYFKENKEGIVQTQTQLTDNVNNKINEKQLVELDKLREQIDVSSTPLNQEQINSQLKTFDVYRKKIEAKSLTQEEIQKQLEELEKLRSQ